MHRFYCPSLAGHNTLELPDPEAHHARRVLRLEDGAAVELFDGAGAVAPGVLHHRGKRGALMDVGAVRQIPPLTPQIDIAAALPKGDRAAEMVNQLSQLGASRLIPLATGRTTVHPREAKLDKLRRTSVEAAKQCGRAHLMAIGELNTLAEVLCRPYDARLLAAPADAVRDPGPLPTRAERILVLIGPEGGWADDEVAAATEAGCMAWCFAPHVLRIETAAAAAVAILRAR